jgi:hypothetical protein
VVLLEPPGVEDHHVGAAAEQGAELPGGHGRGARRGLDQLPERLAGCVDVAEELAAPGYPAGQPALQQ